MTPRSFVQGFDSTALLNLVAWVEDQADVPMDPMAVDPLIQRERMRDILIYCADHSRISSRTNL